MHTIHKILVPIDFSETSLNSLEYAAALAKPFNAKVVVFHAYHVEVPVADSSLLPEISSLVYMEELERQLKFGVREKFKKVEKDIFYSNIPAHSFITREGPVEDQIKDIVEDEQIDLIVMASSGPHPFLQIFGSHITHLMNQCKKPILAVPPNVKFSKIKEILLTTDYGPVSEQMDAFLAFASLNNARIQIFNNESGDEDESVNVVAVASFLNKLLRSIPHTFHRSSNENVEEAILSYVENHKIDLVVLLPRHHNLIEKVFRGSITKNMTFHCSLPLLIMPE